MCHLFNLFSRWYISIGGIVPFGHPEGPLFCPKKCLLHSCRTALRHVLPDKKKTDPYVLKPKQHEDARMISVLKITDLKNQMSNVLPKKNVYMVLPSYQCLPMFRWQVRFREGSCHSVLQVKCVLSQRIAGQEILKFLQCHINWVYVRIINLSVEP